ncbi:hypothetical protein BMS3Bbin15_01612 [archaeon BMS3Bbin15]|nr:hypothetical protein BMS3Bbin15_01612 [archaeon BMS3Bbin15]
MPEENKIDTVIELKIKSPKNIYHELAVALEPYKERPTCSVEFIVEGTKDRPTIGIRYPGRKALNRVRAGRIKKVRANSAEWANLFDFLVIPYVSGKELTQGEFTFEKILRDFQDNKRKSEEFWELIEELYKHNTISKEPPKLPGIDSKLYLLVLKWIWIQEDFNYKLGWQDVNSHIRYVLETRTGTSTSKGAGRGKFYAALILLKHNFNFDVVKKIIPLY